MKTMLLAVAARVSGSRGFSEACPHPAQTASTRQRSAISTMSITFPQQTEKERRQEQKTQHNKSVRERKSERDQDRKAKHSSHEDPLADRTVRTALWCDKSSRQERVSATCCHRAAGESSVTLRNRTVQSYAQVPYHTVEAGERNRCGIRSLGTASLHARPG